MQADLVFVHAARATLAIVFLVAAWQKMRELDVFEAALANYRLLPEALVALTARALPAFELATGLALVIAPGSALGGLAALALLLLVTGAVVINLLRGRRDVGCGCGGIEDEQMVSWALVARNIALLMLALVALAPPVTRDLVWLDYLSVAGSAVAGYGIYLVSSQLIANAPRLGRLRTST
ncbi:MAG: MauE/DoxX family redox-associated membrane protein [Gammaproteobacteria bacterium]